MKDKSYSKAIAAAIVTQIFWGLSFLASSIGQESASPFVLIAIALISLCSRSPFPCFWASRSSIFAEKA